MKSFFRENPMIVVSVALPLLLVALFALASVVPVWLTAPPEHDLLLAVGARESARTLPVRVDVDVANGRLRARVYQRDDSERRRAPAYQSLGNVPRLFLWTAASGEVREVELPMPDDVAELPDGTELPIAALDGRRISDAIRAPDGYEYQGLQRSRGGLFTGLFGGSRRGDVRLSRNGRIVRVRLPPYQRPYYGDVRFLGWVVE